MHIELLIAFFISSMGIAIAQNEQYGSQRVVITSPVMLPVDKAQSTPTVDLVAPVSRSPVFCVASLGSRYIRFSCPDCNITNINQTLREKASEVTEAGFPNLMLFELDVTKKMNQKTLLCEARFQDANGQEKTVEARTRMNVVYFEKPVITDSEGNLPVRGGRLGQEGYKFYIPRRGGSKSLTCRADANPPASSYSWSLNGEQIGTSQQISVDSARVGSTIQCTARGKDLYSARDSESVKLEPWDTPRVMNDNYDQLKRERLSGNNKIQTGRSLSLQCTVYGNPAPIVLWKQQVGTSVMNASCTPTVERIQGTSNNNLRNGQPSRINNNNIYYRSSCTVHVKDYTKAGTYWCSACNSVAQNKYFCEPSQSQAPAKNVRMDVQGRPQKSDVIPYVVQANRDSPAYVHVAYCSDPEPVIPRQIYWTIGDRRLDIMQSWGHYRAERPQRNTTFYDCYTERLVISPVTSEDEKNTYVLTIINRYGEEKISVPVKNMLGNPENSSSAAWIILLVLGILLLLIIIAVAFCFWRKLFCFARTKRSSEQKYHSNLAPEHMKSDPMPPKYDAPPVNGYNSEMHTNGYPKKEGLTYAEMDLVREPSRPAVATPTEYSHIQHSYPLKSPTNSVV